MAMTQESTKRRIIVSFVDLLLNLAFSKISITKICNKSAINRSTFYEYFKNRNELLNCTFKMLTISSQHLTTSELLDWPLDTFIKIAKDPLPDIIEKQQHDSTFNQIYQNYFFNYYYGYFRHISWTSTVPAELFARVYVNTALSFVQWEDLNQTKLSTERYNHYFHEIIRIPKF